MTAVAHPLIDGAWPTATGEVFRAVDPSTGSPLGSYRQSPSAELEVALSRGAEAFSDLQDLGPGAVGAFLDRYATAIEDRATEICATAAAETGLPVEPRLLDVELPRTTDQLRQAARACATRTWVHPVVSPAARIASLRRPIPGPVVVFGPNNFPLAFNAVSGGDFAAAVATLHPVLAVANPGHPGTTRLLAEQALEAVAACGLPPATVQMVYGMSHEDGFTVVADRRVAAVGFTGSRRAGLALKAAADAAGTPIYLEMSSINPVVVLPGAAAADPEGIADTLASSLLLGGGQFCTSPGVIFLIGDEGQAVLDGLAAKIERAPAPTLLTKAVQTGLEEMSNRWSTAGARLVAHGALGDAHATFPNTLMAVDVDRFVDGSDETLHQEAFGNMSLVVEAATTSQVLAALATLEGNLTGTVFTSGSDADNRAYPAVEAALTPHIGRLLNNKPPTGVAVVPAMNHGGPYPSTGHPGFTSVGIPTSLDRFTRIVAYDNVSDPRLPVELQASNPLNLQRRVDGEWSRASFTWG